MGKKGGWMRFPDGRRGCNIHSELVDVKQEYALRNTQTG